MIPIIALSGIYIINKSEKKVKKEGMELPNTNIEDKNYNKNEKEKEKEIKTSKLSVENKYEGGVYTDKYFREEKDEKENWHNNMVPYFGGKIRTGINEYNKTESIMDNYNGSGSQYISKREQAPLFEKEKEIQWVNGMPNYSEFERSRMNVSKKMSNVKPFEEIKVGPGIGLGYGNEGIGGYNSGMLGRELWMEKNVDELRVENKKKASGLISLGYEGPATSIIKNLGTIGRQEKNKVETAYEMNSDRYFTTVGQEKRNKLQPIGIEKEENRPSTSIQYEGIAGYYNSAEYNKGEYKESIKKELRGYELGPIACMGEGLANEKDYGNKSYSSNTNNREINNKNDKGYLGVVSAYFTNTISPIMDNLRPSKKMNVIGSCRPYQNPKTQISESYIYDPNDKPLTTIKETTVNSLNHLNINANYIQRGGGYEITGNQAITNQRDTTTDYQYIGSAKSKTQEPRNQMAEYNQINNEKKSSTLKSYMNTGNMKIFDGYQNIEQTGLKEKMTNQMGRQLIPKMPYNVNSTPDYSNGKIKDKQTNYSNIMLDRNNGEVLTQLRNNPFNHNIANYYQ